MAKIVTCAEEVVGRIAEFNEGIELSPKFQARLAYPRAWYALKDRNGDWIFGPSKFIGYQDLTIEDYISSTYDLDGRKTEAQLSKWFQAVEDNTDFHNELWDSLAKFLGKYGKEPSRSTRISVLDESRDEFISERGQASKIVDLIAEVARSLPAPQLRRLKDMLSA